MGSHHARTRLMHGMPLGRGLHRAPSHRLEQQHYAHTYRRRGASHYHPTSGRCRMYVKRLSAALYLFCHYRHGNDGANAEPRRHMPCRGAALALASPRPHRRWTVTPGFCAAHLVPGSPAVAFSPSHLAYLARRQHTPPRLPRLERMLMRAHCLTRARTFCRHDDFYHHAHLHAAHWRPVALPGTCTRRLREGTYCALWRGLPPAARCGDDFSHPSLSDVICLPQRHPLRGTWTMRCCRGAW